MGKKSTLFFVTITLYCIELYCIAQNQTNFIFLNYNICVVNTFSESKHFVIISALISTKSSLNLLNFVRLMATTLLKYPNVWHRAWSNGLLVDYFALDSMSSIHARASSWLQCPLPNNQIYKIPHDRIYSRARDNLSRGVSVNTPSHFRCCMSFIMSLDCIHTSIKPNRNETSSKPDCLAVGTDTETIVNCHDRNRNRNPGIIDWERAVMCCVRVAEEHSRHRSVICQCQERCRWNNSRAETLYPHERRVLNRVHSYSNFKFHWGFEQYYCWLSKCRIPEWQFMRCITRMSICSHSHSCKHAKHIRTYR